MGSGNNCLAVACTKDSRSRFTRPNGTCPPLSVLTEVTWIQLPLPPPRSHDQVAPPLTILSTSENRWPPICSTLPLRRLIHRPTRIPRWPQLVEAPRRMRPRRSPTNQLPTPPRMRRRQTLRPCDLSAASRRPTLSTLFCVTTWYPAGGIDGPAMAPTSSSTRGSITYPSTHHTP